MINDKQSPTTGASCGHNNGTYGLYSMRGPIPMDAACSDDTPKQENPPTNIELYEQIVNELKQIYKDKNHDYGNSFSILFEKFGLESTVIRLWDKILRLETLTKTEAKVKDESIKDTLMDMANYCIMSLVEIQRMELTGKCP